jgi:hypothetical protein
MWFSGRKRRRRNARETTQRGADPVYLAADRKIISPIDRGQPEQAQIAVEGAEPLYREIRVENTLQDEAGNPVSLKQGAEVEVTIAAKPEATTPVKPTETNEPLDQLSLANKKKGS